MLSSLATVWKVLAGFFLAMAVLMVILLRRQFAYFRSIERTFRATRKWRLLHQQVLFRGEYGDRPVMLLLQWGGGFRTRLHIYRPFGGTFNFEYPPEYRRGLWGRDVEVDYVVLRDEAGREIKGVKVHQSAARKRGDALSRLSAGVLQPLRDRKIELALHEGYLVLTHRSLNLRWKPAEIGEAISAAGAVAEAIGWTGVSEHAPGAAPMREEIAGDLPPESAPGSFRTVPFSSVDRWGTFRRAWRRHVPLVMVTALLFVGIGFLMRERGERLGWTAMATVEVSQSGGKEADLYVEVQGGKESARSFAEGVIRESMKTLEPQIEKTDASVRTSFVSPLGVRGNFKLFGWFGLGVGFLLALWLEGLRRLAASLAPVRVGLVEKSGPDRRRVREAGDMTRIVWKRQWVLWLTALVFAALDLYASDRMARAARAAGHGWLASREVEKGGGADVRGEPGIWAVRLDAAAATPEECSRLITVMLEKARAKAPKWISWDEAQPNVEPYVLPWSPLNTWPALLAGIGVGLGLLLVVEQQAQRRRRGRSRWGDVRR